MYGGYSISLFLSLFFSDETVQVSYLRIIIARTFAGLMFSINNSNVKAPCVPQKFVSSSERRLIAPNRFSRPGRMKRVRLNLYPGASYGSIFRNVGRGPAMQLAQISRRK